MTLDITNLILGSGFATFLALLAWGNQIKGPRKEVMQLEEAFRKEFKINKNTSNALIKDSFNKNKSSKFTFLQQTKAVLNVFDNPDFKDKDLSLFNRFKKLNGIRKQLEGDYNFRYLASVWLCIELFILAGLLIAFPSLSELQYGSLIFVVIHIAIIIRNFFRIHKGEKVFMNEMSSIDDNIEVES